MKDFYSFIILNENKNFNKSFKLSKNQIITLLFTKLLVMALLFWGIFYMVDKLNDPVQKISTPSFSDQLDISFSAPVDGYITKTINSNHSGIDIACELNTNIRAFSDGIVLFSGFEENYGNTIIIAHEKNYYSQYSHLNQINVQPKSKVLQGDIIGLAGETGQLASGPHLHFEIWEKSSIIDPQNIIQEYKENDVSTK